MFRSRSKHGSSVSQPAVDTQLGRESRQQPEARQDGAGTWFRDAESGMPYDYEYLTRLGWHPRHPAERARQTDGSAPRSRGHYGKGPKGYTRSDDRILEDVCERLRADLEVDATELSVTVRSGEVTFEGQVPDRFQEHRAIDVAESVRGVSRVTSHLSTGRRSRAGGPS